MASPLPTIDVAIGLIWRDGRLLIARRPEGAHLAGLWEFPGGKIRPGETPEAALVREAEEELAVQVAVERERPFALEFSYPDRRVRLRVFDCRWLGGEPQCRSCAEWRWVTPDDLTAYDFPPANELLLRALAARRPGV